MGRAVVVYGYSEVRLFMVLASSIGIVRLLGLLVYFPSEERADYLYYRGISSSAGVYARLTSSESGRLRGLVIRVTILRYDSSSYGDGILQSCALRQLSIWMGSSRTQRLGVVDLIRGLFRGLQSAFARDRHSRYSMAYVTIESGSRLSSTYGRLANGLVSGYLVQ